MQENEKTEYEAVMSTYYGDDQVTALINLKVDTKDVDKIAERAAKSSSVSVLSLVLTEMQAKSPAQRRVDALKRILGDISWTRGRKSSTISSTLGSQYDHSPTPCRAWIWWRPRTCSASRR